MTTGQSGRQLIAGRYAVRALIGRGGSGAVWRGEDLYLKRPVAVKQIVVSDTHSTRSRTRAMREAQAAAKLDAPGVVRVYDVHEDDGQVCLIMELIEAPSLARLVRRNGTFTPQRAAVVGLSMLHTLQAVHAAGIVHRDIKPSNVLVGDCGVHITDFGIALLADDPAVTDTGSVLGTPTYMAPEQARGERVGPAADLYGLAATLYFAVEGRPPFDDVGSVATTRAVREQPHRPAGRLGPLEGTIDALLCKDPEARPGAHAVAAALEAAADGTGPVTSPTINNGHGIGDLTMTGASTVRTGDDGTAADEQDAARTDDAPTATRARPATGEDGDSPVDVRRHDRRRDDHATAGAADDTVQQRRTLLVVTALLALLALALVLLFLAVRDSPDTLTGAAAVFATRPTMGEPRS